MKEQFKTEDIDLAAAIMNGTGIKPATDNRSALVVFVFPITPAVHDIILEYGLGTLMQPVKKYSACRAWLYRQMKRK